MGPQARTRHSRCERPRGHALLLAGVIQAGRGKSMRSINVAAAIVACVAACGGNGGSISQPVTKAGASDTVRCSASAGPLVGPADTLIDAGDVQECGPGGQCLSGAFPGPQGVCTTVKEPSDGSPGEVSCPPSSSGPMWSCVYASGVASPGDDGG
jgi:hypothetical protein